MTNDIQFFQFGDKEETHVRVDCIIAWKKIIQLGKDRQPEAPFDYFLLHVYTEKGLDIVLKYCDEESIDLDVKALSAQS